MIKIGVGLRIDKVNLPLLNSLSLDFVVPYCYGNGFNPGNIKNTEVVGATLLSAHDTNNKYLWKRYQFLSSYSVLESEQFIKKDIFQTIESSPNVQEWEVFNELLKDTGKRRPSSLWNSDFPERLTSTIRTTFPELKIIYSDYNLYSPVKRSAIVSLIDDLNLDGLAIQSHLSMSSMAWVTFYQSRIFRSLVAHLKNKGRSAWITEAMIRLECPSTAFFRGGSLLRDKTIVKDFLQYAGLRVIPIEVRRSLSYRLWQYLYQEALIAGVERFYCFKTDTDYEIDEPTFINRNFKQKLLFN